MEITLNEMVSKVTKRLETEINDYKVVVNITINNGVIEQLNGNINPAKVEEGKYVEGYYFNAYKRNGEWATDVSGITNTEYAKVSEIAVAAVDFAVKNYETA